MGFIDTNSTTLTNTTLLTSVLERNQSRGSAPTLLTTPQPAVALQADSITLQGAAKNKDHAGQVIVNLHEGNPFAEGIHNAQKSYARNTRLAAEEQAKVTGRTTPYAIAGAVMGAVSGAALGYFVGGSVHTAWQGAVAGTAFGALAIGMNGFCTDMQHSSKAQGYRISAAADQTAIEMLSEYDPK